MKPVVVDAMGGDNAPSIVIEGVREAIDAGIPVELVGDPHIADDCGDIFFHSTLYPYLSNLSNIYSNTLPSSTLSMCFTFSRNRNFGFLFFKSH